MKTIIIGGGKTGSAIGELLLNKNYNIAIVEKDEKNYNKLLEIFPKEILRLGSGTDPELLEELDILKTDLVMAVTGSDETNLVASTLSKMEFGVPEVVARINHPKNEWLFTRQMGVDYPFNQVKRMAEELVSDITK